MAKISLRAYNREIGTLVERGQNEEAIAHCKYILKTYSKHLDTYRLLGKAFLESQRYSEAADILQRILSVLPDDFVAQIGMSIIREDEGNLDAALFHMERAFEIQPSNAAIHDELRRLYGRRDGIEPPKLRLSRGALVRMYARGDLYRQAIAEARVALSEDTQRLDLNIVLAKMYFLLGQKAEAAEISSRLVSKLPFCYEANRILAEVLPETSRAEDAKIYQQRLLSLDPYLGYISETTPTTSQVPDQAVTIDRLEWTPSMETNQQPAWAKSLGISIDFKQEEDKSEDWLTSFSSPPEMSKQEFPAPRTFLEEIIPSSAPVSDQTVTPENESQPDRKELEEIPNWMGSAGWAVSDHPVEEPPDLAPAEPESPFGEDAELAPAEMPDWLKDLSPVAGPTSTTMPEDQEKLDWLASILPEEPNPSLENIEATQSPSVMPAVSSPPFQAFVSPINEELPDWMRSGPTSPDDTGNHFEISEEPLPDWLTESTEMTEKNEQIPSAETSLPQRENIGQPEQQLESVTAETPDPNPSSLAELQPNEVLSVPEATLISQTPAEEPNPIEPANTDLDAAFAWLESLAAKQGAEDANLFVPPEERLEKPPDWVKEQSQETGEERPAETANEPANAEWIPEWLKSSEEAPVSPHEEIPQTQELPEWLKALESSPDSTFEAVADLSYLPTTPEETIPPTEPASEAVGADWIQETQDDNVQETSLSSIEKAVPVEEEKTAPVEPSSSSELEPSSSEKTGPPPRWLATASLNMNPPLPEPAIPETEESPLPDWLQEESPLTSAGGESIPSKLPSSEGLPLPAWLQNIEPEKVDVPLPETPEVPSTPLPSEIVTSSDPAEMIKQAQSALSGGQIDLALTIYTTLVQQDQQIEETIHDLRDALYRFPVESSIWQTLGDALIRANQVQDALDAYTKAEELLK